MDYVENAAELTNINRVNNIDLAYEMAHDMKRFMDTKVELDADRLALTALAASAGQKLIVISYQNVTYFRDDIERADRTLRSAQNYLSRGAEEVALETKDRYEAQQEVSLQEELFGGANEINRYRSGDSGGNPRPYPDKSDKDKLYWIANASSNKQKISDMLKLVGSAKTVEELSDDEVKEMINLLDRE